MIFKKWMHMAQITKLLDMSGDVDVEGIQSILYVKLSQIIIIFLYFVELVFTEPILQILL
jgi:hypothetical protein